LRRRGRRDGKIAVCGKKRIKIRFVKKICGGGETKKEAIESLTRWLKGEAITRPKEEGNGGWLSRRGLHSGGMTRKSQVK